MSSDAEDTVEESSEVKRLKLMIKLTQRAHYLAPKLMGNQLDRLRAQLSLLEENNGSVAN